MSIYHKKEIESVAEFDKWAETYGQGFWSGYFNGGYIAALKAAQPYLTKNSFVLDIGCGTGVLENLLAGKVPGGQLLGIDISSAMIDRAIEEVEKKHKNVSFMCSSASKIPCKDASVDVAFSLNSLHHIPKHTTFFKEINRVLKPCGIFVLLDLISDNPLRRTWIPIMKIIFREKDVEFHTKEQLRSLADTASLEILDQNLFWYFTAVTVLKKA